MRNENRGEPISHSRFGSSNCQLGSFLVLNFSATVLRACVTILYPRELLGTACSFSARPVKNRLDIAAVAAEALGLL